jgi:PAS domain-containing protein
MPTEHPAEFLRALLDAAPFGVIAVDAAGRHAAQTILGWSEDEIVGRIPPSGVELPREGSVDADAWLTRNDGTAVEVKIRTVPWQGGTLTILMDNRGNRRAERAMQDMVGREEEALTQVRAERRFHELLEAAPDA